MKRILLFMVILLISGVAMGQTAQTTKVSEPTKSHKVIKADSKKESKSTYTPTGVYYEIKGVEYEIYTHKITRGDNAGKVACYVKRVSKKSGKEYWQKIDVKPEELSK